MTNKVLVEVILPAADEKFDVFVPLESRLSEVVMLLSKMLSELCDGKYKASNDAIICDADTGTIFNLNMELAELGIRNGSRLLLI